MSRINALCKGRGLPNIEHWLKIGPHIPDDTTIYDLEKEIIDLQTRYFSRAAKKFKDELVQNMAINAAMIIAIMNGTQKAPSVDTPGQN